MKNRKGFTMVELLVTIVILGVITGMSWPLVRRLQEQNAKSKYTTYGDGVVSAAKIYVDSFEEDLFYYEDDLPRLNDTEKETAKNNGELLSDELTQCAMISVTDLINHNLIKDINMDEISCVSNYSFVIVKKKKNNYDYKYYLGCGKKKTRELINSEISMTIPEDLAVAADGVKPSLKDYCKLN